MFVHRHAYLAALRRKAKQKKEREQNEIRRPVREHTSEYYERRDQLLEEKENERNQNELQMKEVLTRFQEDHYF